MASLTRRIANGAFNPAMRGSMIEARGKRSNAVKDASPLGYTVCHFTKGWRRVSAKRLRAQHRMARLLGA